jgi:hypothetical protein
MNPMRHKLNLFYLYIQTMPLYILTITLNWSPEFRPNRGIYKSIQEAREARDAFIKIMNIPGDKYNIATQSATDSEITQAELSNGNKINCWIEELRLPC